MEKPLQMKTAYGLNEKVIANAIFSLSSDNAGCQVKNKRVNHMALNSHVMSWNSFLHTCIIYLLYVLEFFFAYLYNLSPANRISFVLFTFHMLVQILFCTVFTKNTKQHGRH